MWLIFVLIICLKGKKKDKIKKRCLNVPVCGEQIDKNKKNPQQTNKHAYHKNKLILRVQ